MFSVNNGNITVTKGDTGRIRCTYSNALTGEDYEIGTEDKLIFTVRRQSNDNIVLQKVVSGSEVIRLYSSETDSLSIGKYSYDVQLQTVDGEVSTIGPFIFEVQKGFLYRSV